MNDRRAFRASPPPDPTGAVRVFPGEQRQRASSDIAVVRNWLHTYICGPHAGIGRSGPVCPFVLPSLKANSMRFRLHYGVTGDEGAQLRALLLAEFAEFRADAPFPRTATASLDGALVILPDSGPTGWYGIDAAYLELKDEAVRQGLMIGQFHPNCDERAVRNPAFPVSLAPIGLLAIRHMAPHDILFLHGRRTWFEAYERRFGAHYAAGKIRDAFMQGLYQRARDEFGPGGSATPPGKPGCPAHRPESTERQERAPS